MSRPPFTLRGFVSLLAFVLFFLMTVTGVVAYLMPQGRVAYWIDWRLMGFSKDDWGGVHTVSSLLFVPVALWHLVLNWRPFKAWIFNRVRQSLRLRWEPVAAVLIAVAVTAGTLHPVPPMSWLLDLGESFKRSWVVSPEYEPPFGHAEQVSFRVLCKKMGIPLPEALAALDAGGIPVSDPALTIEELAFTHGTTPMELYRLIRHLEPLPEPDARYRSVEELEEVLVGSGLGQKTLARVAEQFGLDPEWSRGKLAGAGIEVAEGEVLKKVAERYGLRPVEVVAVLLVEGYRPAIAP